MKKLSGSVLNPGTAEGPLLFLDEPLSFWGGFDPQTGIILDARHPQKGRSIARHVLFMRETRGSGSAAGGIAEALRLGTAPLGIILGSTDLNLAIGAFVASLLYRSECPVLAVADESHRSFSTAHSVEIDRNGEITLL